MSHDADLNQYSWIYTGGCFAGGKPVQYDDVRPGEIRNFKDVQFEVRLDQRSWDDITLTGEGFGDMSNSEDVEQESDSEKEARL